MEMCCPVFMGLDWFYWDFGGMLSCRQKSENTAKFGKGKV